MNLVIISGNITKDNELKVTSNGTEVLSNTLAVRKNNDESVFIKFTAFKKTAEFLNNYTKKGSKILIEGSIEVNSYERKDGSKAYDTYVIVNQVELIGAKKEQNQQVQEEKEEPSQDQIDFGDDDLPF